MSEYGNKTFVIDKSTNIIFEYNDNLLCLDIVVGTFEKDPEYLKQVFCDTIDKYFCKKENK